MIFRCPNLYEKFERKNKWHKWFAWHPVWWDGGFAWLSYVERSLKIDSYSGVSWYYRPPNTGDE